jgi:hypothetical protein
VSDVGVLLLGMYAEGEVTSLECVQGRRCCCLCGRICAVASVYGGGGRSGLQLLKML